MSPAAKVMIAGVLMIFCSIAFAAFNMYRSFKNPDSFGTGFFSRHIGAIVGSAAGAGVFVIGLIMALAG